MNRPSFALVARTAAALLTAFAVCLATLVAVPATASVRESGATGEGVGTRIVAAADLTQFRPGNIISNEVFFDSSTMSAGQVDSFLRQRVPQCRSGYVCLKDFKESTFSRAADRYCGAYTGAASESAAQIIHKVAQSCGINPQVLIVTLEKEQGLVTHTWPSDWRYTIAMGQACPDTAACDSRYYGFYNQVYGAARQFKIYTENRYFTYYAPGRTWNIRYNPNSACGSSPVYIENQATANLYYYTPYQPNAAALRAGYGQGDGCSAYGNRNFYQRFTDWFGSTQSRYGALIQASGRGEVYLVSGGVKHHVASWDDLVVLQSRFGAVSAVTTSYADALATGPQVGRYVHDPRSGTLYLLEADGSKHRFTSTGQVATFGYPFDSYVDLEPRLIDAFTTGSEVGAFIRIGGAPETFVLSEGTRRHIFDRAAWMQASQGTSGFVATMRPEAAAAIPSGPTLFAANTLIRGASSPDVLLVTKAGPLIHIPSFSLAAEFGATAYGVVPDAAVAGSQIAPAPLAPAVSCGSQRYLAAGGTLFPLTGEPRDGLPTLSLTSAQCAAWTTSTSALTAPVFVQSRTGGQVYSIEQGRLRHVRTYEDLLAINGSRSLNIVTWSAETVAWVGLGAPYLADRSLVQFAGTPEVYRFSARELHHVQSYASLLEPGSSAPPRIEILPAGWLSSYKVGAPIP